MDKQQACLKIIKEYGKFMGIFSNFHIQAEREKIIEMLCDGNKMLGKLYVAKDLVIECKNDYDEKIKALEQLLLPLKSSLNKK